MQASGICREVFMVRPVKFEFNYQTAVDNPFQHEPVNGMKKNTQALALLEFEGMVQMLRDHKIEVTVGNDTPEPHTPDSCFPTNWVSTLPNGTICFYPMKAKNRRLERKPELINLLNNTYHVDHVIDYTEYENEERYLEGAASVIIDHPHGVAYACLSDRTHRDLVEKFVEEVGVEKCVIFEGKDDNGTPIYHSDVMMCIADKYVTVCLDSIADPAEKELLVSTIQSTGKEVIPFSIPQLSTFVGNMIQLQNSDGEKFAIMSTKAFKSLTEAQRRTLESYNQILHSDLSTIETVGGGSAQCLMAKIYLQKKKH